MSITEVPKAQNIGFSSSYDKKKLHSKSPDAKSMDGICHKEFFFFSSESGSQISACSLSVSLSMCLEWNGNIHSAASVEKLAKVYTFFLSEMKASKEF